MAAHGFKGISTRTTIFQNVVYCSTFNAQTQQKNSAKRLRRFGSKPHNRFRFRSVFFAKTPSYVVERRQGGKKYGNMHRHKERQPRHTARLPFTKGVPAPDPAGTSNTQQYCALFGGFCLGQTRYARNRLQRAAFTQQVDTFEAFENTALFRGRRPTAFETVVLRHKITPF